MSLHLWVVSACLTASICHHCIYTSFCLLHHQGIVNKVLTAESWVFLKTCAHLQTTWLMSFMQTQDEIPYCIESQSKVCLPII